MFNSDICVKRGVSPTLRKGKAFPKPDQFCSTDFFKEGGLKLRDFNVFAKAAADPELQMKLREYIIENDVQGFDSSVSDDDVFNSIQSKYDSTSQILARVKERISYLRDHPEEEKKD